MSKIYFQRARHDDQKEIRRSLILLEAEKQITNKEYSSISVAQIAASLKMAKGTVFVYFPTKETLFLSVAELKFIQWFEIAMQSMQRSSKKSEVVDHLLWSLQQVPVLPKLISLLHGVLEHNVEVDRVISFKMMLRHHLIKLGALIDQRLSWKKGAGAQGLLNLHTLIIGSYQMAHPSPAVAKALKSDELALFRIDMMAQLQKLLPLVFRNTSIEK